MRNRESVKRLSQLKGGFFIPRSDIISTDVIHKQKWGMASIPHSGRVRIRMASGGSREFVLLGSVDAESIQQCIFGATPAGRIPDAPQASLPYVFRCRKQFWVPLFVLAMFISARFLWGFSSFWKTSNWTLRGESLFMIALPLLVLLQCVVPHVRFTDSEIQRTTSLGRITMYPYSAIRKLSTAYDGSVAIEFSDGKKLKLPTGQGNPRVILSILQAKTRITMSSSTV
jgi:hypothetical protein